MVEKIEITGQEISSVGHISIFSDLSGSDQTKFPITENTLIEKGGTVRGNRLIQVQITHGERQGTAYMSPEEYERVSEIAEPEQFQFLQEHDQVTITKSNDFYAVFNKGERIDIPIDDADAAFEILGLTDSARKELEDSGLIQTFIPTGSIEKYLTDQKDGSLDTTSDTRYAHLGATASSYTWDVPSVSISEEMRAGFQSIVIANGATLRDGRDEPQESLSVHSNPEHVNIITPLAQP